MSATSQYGDTVGVWTGERGSRGGADSRVGSAVGAVDDVGQVVVPAVGVIVGDDDGGRGPEARFLDGVDGVDDEGLFVERIGVTGVRHPGSGGFEEADGWHDTSSESVGEVMHVVLVVGLVRGSDCGGRTQVVEIRRCWPNTGRAGGGGCNQPSVGGLEC